MLLASMFEVKDTKTHCGILMYYGMLMNYKLKEREDSYPEDFPPPNWVWNPNTGKIKLPRYPKDN